MSCWVLRPGKRLCFVLFYVLSPRAINLSGPDVDLDTNTHLPGPSLPDGTGQAQDGMTPDQRDYLILTLTTSGVSPFRTCCVHRSFSGGGMRNRITIKTDFFFVFPSLTHWSSRP